jgi:hypothetical protein
VNAIAVLLKILAYTMPGTKVLGISIGEIVKIWPQLVTAESTLAGVVEQLKAAGVDPLAAAANVLGMVAKVHPMTPAEEKIWADRASNAGTGGG